MNFNKDKKILEFSVLIVEEKGKNKIRSSSYRFSVKCDKLTLLEGRKKNPLQRFFVKAEDRKDLKKSTEKKEN